MLGTSKDIKYPGLNILPPGVERHVVNGGGLTGFQIFPDDEVEIINNEGNQICEIICFGKDGNSDLGILNLKSNNEKNFIRNILNGNDETILATNYQLKKRNLKISNSKSSIIFDLDAEPGEKIKLKSKDKCYAIFSAPGEDMDVTKQNPPTDLTIFVKRAKIVNDKELNVIPDPVFEPVYEEDINKETSISYEVKEGDYIQVISPTGRQCSDFVAFDTRKLEKGIEKGLDWQTTRTFMGNTFPGPGLFSKFYDTDHEPLVEVIRDTVGKHDTFNLACTSKYYEDAGYFGHPNCSDNLTESMSKYGVQKQKGWHAINLFFNTSAGGLNTNIFVRTYDKNKEFKKSFGFRMKTDSENKLTRNSGFYERTSKLTRNFVDARGFWLPNDYTKHGLVNEYNACRNDAVLIDLSSLRKFEIIGPDAEELMNYTLTRNIKKLSVGQVVYSAMCYENGMMFDDGTLLRLSETGFRWICGDDTICRIEELQGIPLIVSRTGYTGELGYEVWCHPKHAPEVWDKLMEAGKDDGLIPAGFAALDKLRIEAGLILFGAEFDGEQDPFEAGIGFAVPLKTKEEDFIGKEELIKRKANPQKKLVGLELNGKEIAGHGDCVHIGRSQVGIVTSGCLSSTLNKNIALCRIDVQYSEIGTEVEIGKIDGHQKRIGAKVVGFPFYDPTKSRVRA